MFFINLIVTTKQNPVIDTQKRKIKEPKQITIKKSSKFKGSGKKKKGKKYLQNNQQHITKWQL